MESIFYRRHSLRSDSHKYPTDLRAENLTLVSRLLLTQPSSNDARRERPADSSHICSINSAPTEFRTEQGPHRCGPAHFPMTIAITPSPALCRRGIGYPRQGVGHGRMPNESTRDCLSVVAKSIGLACRAGDSCGGGYPGSVGAQGVELRPHVGEHQIMIADLLGFLQPLYGLVPLPETSVDNSDSPRGQQEP
jgi:hypothetical protein